MNSEISGHLPAVAQTCKCGAGPSVKNESRCANGHMLRGRPGPALKSGERSEIFWREAEEERDHLRRQVLAGRGLTDNDAPIPALALADGLAQAILIRNSAYIRIIESGGPLSADGRSRKCYEVWLTASDRVQRHASALDDYKWLLRLNRDARKKMSS